MKELYSFSVERKVEEKVPYTRKTKNGPVESTKKVKKTLANRVLVQKPSVSDVENAEFFYGQKFNEYINAGFLTRAMLNKKMGDLGGISSTLTENRVEKLIVENMEASKTIEFYGGSKTLTSEQKEKLESAKLAFADTRRLIHDYETSLREQFNQTADAKAEQRLIEWLVFNFAFYEEEVDDKKEVFPLFEGESYKEKRNFFLELSDEDSDLSDSSFLKVRAIYTEAFEKLIRVVSLWYSKVGNDQESIDKALKELFDSDEE